jgi:hypothetical protein
MNPDPTPAPEWMDRLQSLERRSHRLHGVIVLLILLALVQTAWHFMPGPEVLAASRFVVKKRGGPVRAEMSVWADGTPCFRLNNARGEARALWALRQDGTLSLRMSDHQFNTRVEMMVEPDDTPRIALYGSDGRSRANLRVDSENRAELSYPQR